MIRPTSVEPGPESDRAPAPSARVDQSASRAGVGKLQNGRRSNCPTTEIVVVREAPHDKPMMT